MHQICFTKDILIVSLRLEISHQKLNNKFKYILLDTPQALILEIFAALPNPSTHKIEKLCKTNSMSMCVCVCVFVRACVMFCYFPFIFVSLLNLD
jgi:hypothetical protein